jgi:hypothetical protein
MFVGKRESVLAIDGDYVHIMPPEKTGMFDSVKTTSFHVSSVVSCKQSKKVPSNFKIVVIKDRDHDHKTYELEAETTKDARKFLRRNIGLELVYWRSNRVMLFRRDLFSYPLSLAGVAGDQLKRF